MVTNNPTGPLRPVIRNLRGLRPHARFCGPQAFELPKSTIAQGFARLSEQTIPWFVRSGMGLFIDDEAVAAKSRLVHIALLNLNLRLMENWRSAQRSSAGGALDYDSLMILMAVIVIAAEKVLRADLDPALQSLSRELPRSSRAKVNLSSIAAATAINRETVRRKVHNLQEAGWLLRDKDGIRVVQGVVPYETVRGIISAQLDALTRIFHQLEKLGVITSKPNQI